MEDIAASLMSHPHSAPLYLLYDASSLAKQGRAPPMVHDDDGFEFATAAPGGDAALRACASDVSADDLFRAGVLLPLRLPPRLQGTARSAGASAATSPTSLSAAAGHRTKHTGFDPFAAALEEVRRDAGAAPRRSRSLSPLRGSTAAAAMSARKDSKDSTAPRPTAVLRASADRPTWPARKGVKHLLCRSVMASAAAAPRTLLRPRRKDNVSYRPGLLACFGF